MQKGKRYCPNCGTELRPEARFCPECGEKIEYEETNDTAKIFQEELPEDLEEMTEDEEQLKSKRSKIVKIIIAVVTAALLFGLGYGLYGVIEDKTPKKETEVKAEHKSKTKTAKKKSNSKKIEDQSFHTTIKGIGEVDFISATPNTNKDKYADAIFKIKKDGKVYEKLPGYEKNNIRIGKKFQKVEAVSFQDCNNDNLDDIIIMNSYKKDSENETEARIYTQGSDQRFTLDKDMSSKVNENVSDKTVDSILEYLKPEEKQTEEKTAESEETKQEDTSAGWKQAYINWVNQRPDWEYELFDVNGDNIPEIAAIGKCMADGCYVGTYGNSGVQEVQILRSGIYYMKGQNVIDNESGSMGEYYDRVFKIQDGKWVQIGDGTYVAADDCPEETDEYGNPLFDFTYTWNGAVVSEEEYSSNLGKVFNIEEAEMVNETGATASEIISQIQSY